jgi:two-component system cell cycle sensor histidine kinase/response regulator CckA
MILPTVPGKAEKAPANSSAKTILFTDDHGQLQKLVPALLQRYGYRVIVASGGTDALQRARDFDGTIHLLLSDVDMPGMTGIDLAIQLNQERPDTKILLIASRPTILVLNKGWQFLMKPFMADTLRDRILDFLSEQPPTKGQLPDA